jgi:hypothetical protein
MRPTIIASSIIAAFFMLSLATGAEDPKQPADWSMNATIIEACSCPMFCQCYFDTKPAAHAAKGHEGHAGHAGEHYCKMNNAYKVNTGNYAGTKLDGAKFWLAGDLGGDFSKGQMDWAHLTFDPAVTKEQREGIKTILGHVYPVKWNSFTVGEDKAIDWNGGKDRAEAKLDGGKAAEVVLKKNEGMSDEPIVIKNMRYWGAPRNEGFVLMQNEVEALKEPPAGKEAFEFKGTNGFMITFDINSKDVEKAPAEKAQGGGK